MELMLAKFLYMFLLNLYQSIEQQNIGKISSYCQQQKMHSRMFP